MILLPKSRDSKIPKQQ